MSQFNLDRCKHDIEWTVARATEAVSRLGKLLEALDKGDDVTINKLAVEASQTCKSLWHACSDTLPELEILKHRKGGKQ